LRRRQSLDFFYEGFGIFNKKILHTHELGLQIGNSTISLLFGSFSCLGSCCSLSGRSCFGLWTVKC
jgi:hypothetical protein